MSYRVENISEKEKLLVTSNFCFSHNIFHSFISVVHQNVALCGNVLTLYSINTYFNASTTDSFWKHCRKRSNFFFSHNVFYSIRKLHPHLSIFVNHIFICCWIGTAPNWHVSKCVSMVTYLQFIKELLTWMTGLAGRSCRLHCSLIIVRNFLFSTR